MLPLSLMWPQVDFQFRLALLWFLQSVDSNQGIPTKNTSLASGVQYPPPSKGSKNTFGLQPGGWWDFTSRDIFDARLGDSSEHLAREAFQRMDIHLDLAMAKMDLLHTWKW